MGSLLCLLVFAILSVGIFINAHMQAADEARFAGSRRCSRLYCPTHNHERCASWTKTVTKPITLVRPSHSFPLAHC